MPSILNSDDGVVSGTSGLKSTGGNDGLLNIQSNGSTILAVTGSGISVTGTVSQTGVSTFAAGTVSAPSITFTGDTNTGIFSPGADQVSITTGGTQRVAVDASGNVGIGVTPSTYSSGKAIEIGAVGNGYYTFSAGNSFLTLGGYYNSGWKYSATSQAASQIEFQDNLLIFKRAASGTAGNTLSWSESMRINSSGNVQLSGNLGLGGTTPTTSGTGITFPATQSASTDANTLDDYEEGTWTPSVGGTTSNPTLTYATRVGYYTKVGRVVTIHCGIQPSTTSVNGDGQLVITGLPFTSANLSDCVGTGVSYSNGNLNWGTNKTSLVLAVSPNVTRVSVWGMQNATAEAGVGVTAFTTSSQYLLFSLTYIAA